MILMVSRVLKNKVVIDNTVIVQVHSFVYLSSDILYTQSKDTEDKLQEVLKPLLQSEGSNQ